MLFEEESLVFPLQHTDIETLKNTQMNRDNCMPTPDSYSTFNLNQTLTSNHLSKS